MEISKIYNTEKDFQKDFQKMNLEDEDTYEDTYDDTYNGIKNIYTKKKVAKIWPPFPKLRFKIILQAQQLLQ